jgi:uncharacterized membrane protein
LSLAVEVAVALVFTTVVLALVAFAQEQPLLWLVSHMLRLLVLEVALLTPHQTGLIRPL